MEAGSVILRCHPERIKNGRWVYNVLKREEILYIKPFQSKKRKFSRKRWKWCSSWMLCGGWLGRLTALIVLFCSIGCFYSVWLLSDSYFNYEQSTNIIIQVKEKTKMTALSICLYYPPILQHSHSLFSSLNKKKDSPTIGDAEKKLTLKAIFDMTPSTEQVLINCSYRLPDELDLFQGDKNVCNEFFRVTKYYTVQYICYRFTPNKTANQHYSFLAVRYSLIDPGLFYQINFNQSLFENATDIQPSTYNWNGYPKSRFSTVVKNAPKGSTNKKNETLTHFFFSYYKLRNRLLPAPFPTNCINYTLQSPFSEQSECYDHCMRNLTIQKHNKLPYAAVTKQALPFKLITSSDFENNTFEKEFQSFQKHCSKKVCAKNNCRQLYYVTTYVHREWTSNGLVFGLTTSQSPDLVTEYEPKRELFDFLIDIFNCFSNWYGWSFMDATKLGFIFKALV